MGVSDHPFQFVNRTSNISHYANLKISYKHDYDEYDKHDLILSAYFRFTRVCMILNFCIDDD